MLLLGPDLETHRREPRRHREGGARGDPIGIFNAPGTPPPAGELLPSGWTACTGGDIAAGTQFGVKVAVTEKQVAVPAPETGLVVRSGGKLYVIGESASDRAEPRAYYYEIRQSDADPILRETVKNTSETNAIGSPGSGSTCSRPARRSPWSHSGSIAPGWGRLRGRAGEPPGRRVGR